MPRGRGFRWQREEEYVARSEGLREFFAGEVAGKYCHLGIEGCLERVEVRSRADDGEACVRCLAAHQADDVVEPFQVFFLEMRPI